MDKNRISSYWGEHNDESFRIDGFTMAGIHHNKKNTLVYIARRLSMDMNEIEKMFDSSTFNAPEISFNPTYLKNHKNTFYAKVLFDKA